MARTLEQIQQEFNAASLQARNAYDKLQKMRSSSTFVEDNKAKFEAAQAKYKAAQEKKNSLNKELKDIKKSEESTAKKKTANDAYEKTLEELKLAEIGLSGYQGDTSYQDAYKKAKTAYDAVKALGASPRKPLPEAKVTVQGPTGDEAGATGATGSTGSTGPIETTGAILGTVAANDALLTELQKELKKNFPSIYTGQVDGKKSWAETQTAVATILERRGQLPKELQAKDFRTFIRNSDSADLIITGDGLGGGANLPTYTLSSPTEAASTISYAIKTILGRDATPKEVADLTKVLNDAEKKNPNRTVNGRTSGGLDRLQLITDVIKTGKYTDKKLGKLGTIGKLSGEYTTKQTEKTNLTAQTLLGTAKANGLTLTDDQLKNYSNAVKNGTDIDTVKSQIRNLVASTMPDNVKKMMADGTDLDTIYSPYKYAMQQILEVPNEAINLNDPTLRNAISSNGQMTLYDFQNSLRKDPRWQYTNNARETVSSGLTQVLKDFGFMG
jgi:hypothetical protein